MDTDRRIVADKEVLKAVGTKHPVEVDPLSLNERHQIELHDRGWTRVRRNDTCPCGSGRKFKHCHLRVGTFEEKQTRTLAQAAAEAVCARRLEAAKRTAQLIDAHPAEAPK